MKVPITDSPRWIRFSEDLKKLNFRFPTKELCEKLSYDTGNVSSWINGKKMPSSKFLEKFYEAYGADIDKAEKEIERERREKYAEASIKFPVCADCLLKDKEISELKGQVKLLKELLKDASDNNKSKAISA